MRGGKTYYVTAESMNANALGITYLDAFDAEAMKVFLGNEKCLAVTRDNDTDVAFTEFTTRKYFLGVEGYAVG